jgi:hypothetical protein
MRFEPIFKYFSFSNTKVVIEIDPQDGSDWPYHYLVYCEMNPDTGQWELFKNEWVPLDISKSDKTEAVKEACFQLVSRLNQTTSA